MNAQIDVAAVAAEFRTLLGNDCVFEGTAAQARYGKDTTAAQLQSSLALSPTTAQKLPAVVAIARRHGLSVYPLSTGRNWGYGTAHPPSPGCVLVDLSALRRIIACDEQLGVVTIEPGVTQQDLRDYLRRQRLPFLVPVTGAGPRCSLVGNALERGYGITPHTDHCAAIMSLKAILPDGQVYQGCFAELGATELDRIFKWGIGPYVDGLFVQGNFGIVTEMTIALARVPEAAEAVYFWLNDEHDLEPVVDAIRSLLQQAGGTIGGFNLMNSLRVLTMLGRLPHDVSRARPLSYSQVAAYARRSGISPWMGAGSIYGTQAHVAATRQTIRRLLGPRVKRLLFLKTTWTQTLRFVASRTDWLLPAALRSLAERMASGLELMAGTPNELALPLSYFRSSTAMSSPLDPARDRCGLLWYSPLVPMTGRHVCSYIDMVRATCSEHAMDAPITLTTLSERVFDSTLPLLFDAASPAESDSAAACWRALYQGGAKQGILPYRLPSCFMAEMVASDSTYWQMVRKLKVGIDPQDTIARGRYCISEENG